jgi:hypothetical protein
MSVSVTEPRKVEPVTKSDPPAEPTPSVTETLECPEEATETSSEVEKSEPSVKSTPSVAEVQETLEEATVMLMRVETEVRSENVEQEWELPDWFKQKQLASAARHAQRRAGMRFGMWGFPLETWTPSSAC